MSDRIEALEALAEKVESGEFPVDTSARDLGLANATEATGLPVIKKMYEAFSGSLDAAKALHEAMLPGWAVDDISQNGRLAGEPWGCRLAYWNASRPSLNKTVSYGYGHQNGPDPTTARAWLIAILRALIAEAKEARHGSS